MFAFHLAWAFNKAMKQVLREDRKTHTRHDSFGRKRPKAEYSNRLWMLVSDMKYQEQLKEQGKKHR